MEMEVLRGIILGQDGTNIEDRMNVVENTKVFIVGDINHRQAKPREAWRGINIELDFDVHL